ncbi:hypothetical protein [Neisseria shayeganii]|nr:hypothetical protein [Neisseria shayeganii]
MRFFKVLLTTGCAILLLAGCMDLESRRMRIERGIEFGWDGKSRLERMRAIADEGDPTAQFRVAEAYFDGHFYGEPVEKNLNMAKRYYTLAMNNHHESRWQMDGYRSRAKSRLDEIAKLQDPVYQRRQAQRESRQAAYRNRQHAEQQRRNAALMREVGTKICSGVMNHSYYRVGYIEGFAGRKIKIRLDEGNQVIYELPDKWYVCE